MFIDSHCHLDFAELQADTDNIFALMRENQVTHALTISTTLKTFPDVLKVAEAHDNLWCSAGVHPDEQRDDHEPTVEELLELADHPKVIAIGETGLDYFRLQEPLDWQRERFRTHIRAANICKKPLVIHTRNSSADTLKLMAEENADIASGVMAGWHAPPGIYNLADDLPCSQNRVIEAACDLLGLAWPRLQTIDDANLSPMARAFYAENRRVANGKAKRILAWRPRFADYAAGLRAIIAGQ